MKKIIITILLLSLVGCSNQQSLDYPIGADTKKTIKEKFDKSIIKNKYKLEKSAFIKEAKNDDELRIEVGDKTKDEFVPELTIGKWDEVSMKIKANQNNLAKGKKKLLGADTAELVIEDEKIKYTEDGMDYVFYDIEPNEEHPEGAFEFEIILNEIPATNTIEIEIETDGLDFLYQPELTQEEIDDGAFRPENVVGSYAVYHSTKANHIVGQTDYKTGKAFHMYRPEIEDTNGDKYWGWFNEDLNKTKKLKIYLPEGMVYPIIVDPTFGYTSAGSSNIYYSAASSGGVASYGSVFTTTEAATSVSSLTAYIRYYPDYTNTEGAFTIYLNSNSTLISNGKTPEVEWGTTSSVKEWYTINYSSEPSLLNSTAYNLMFAASHYSYINLYYDAGGSNQGRSAGINWARGANWLPDSPESFSNNNNKYSIYATYTAGGGDTPAPAVRRQGVIWFD